MVGTRRHSGKVFVCWLKIQGSNTGGGGFWCYLGMRLELTRRSLDDSAWPLNLNGINVPFTTHSNNEVTRARCCYLHKANGGFIGLVSSSPPGWPNPPVLGKVQDMWSPTQGAHCHEDAFCSHNGKTFRG